MTVHQPTQRRTSSYLDMQAELEAQGVPRFAPEIEPQAEICDWDGRRGTVLSVAADRRSCLVKWADGETSESNPEDCLAVVEPIPEPAAAHTCDADCLAAGMVPTLDEMDECPVCHVLHGEPCPWCGDRGYHKPDCQSTEVDR